MTETPNPTDGVPTQPMVGDVARLQGQVDSMRSLLIRLLQDVVRGENRLDNSRAAQLLEANERLVVTALSAQSEAEKAAQALHEAARLSELDALTQLPNRALLLDRLRHAMAGAERHGGRLAVLFLDLDAFKQVNDSLGHAAGDNVLKLAAHRLSGAVRAADTVGRYGGDEFLILLTEVSQPSDAALIADKVLATLAAPGTAGGHPVQLTASIGISLYPDDGVDTDTLIARADTAMYRAKAHGPGSYAFHGRPPAEGPGPVARPPTARREPASAEHERRHALLREANEKLLLAALGAQALQAAAEQALRRQSEFIEAVANELRNPLAPIRIATAMLGRAGTDEPLMPRVQALVERQVTQISHLVGEVLDVSRSAAGTLALERRAVDMARLVADAAAACRPAMGLRQQQLEVRLPTSAIEVDGDPARLAQVLNNLLDNASRYTPEGGTITLSLAVEGGAMVMTVADNGIGITAQALPGVFGPFGQDILALDFNGTGLGIGLTVVRALVEAHGGRVVAQSAGSGRGSEFVVRLPLAGTLRNASAAPDAGAPSVTGAAPGAGR